MSLTYDFFRWPSSSWENRAGFFINLLLSFITNFLLLLLYSLILIFAVLVVVTSIMEHVFEVDPSPASHIVVMCCVYLRLLNSFNLVTLFLCRQRDFRRAAIRCLKYIFCGQKYIQPVVTVGFVTRTKHTIFWLNGLFHWLSVYIWSL